MRYFILYLLLSTFLFSNAQKQSSSYLPEFEKQEKRKGSTIDKIKADILSLADAQIKQEITEKGLQYFNFSLIFIVDANGNIVNDDIRFMSEVTSLKAPAIKYVTELPKFVPKVTKEDEHRDVYIIDETYIVNQNDNSFYKADNNELRQKNIKPSYLKADEYPTFPGCGEIKDNNFNCVAGKLREIFTKHLVIPRSLPNGSNRAYVKFIINTDGSIEVDEIDTPNADFKREIKRIFRKVPDMTPGKVSGIPFRSSFGLPLVVNVG